MGPRQSLSRSESPPPVFCSFLLPAALRAAVGRSAAQAELARWPVNDSKVITIFTEKARLLQGWVKGGCRRGAGAEGRACEERDGGQQHRAAQASVLCM